ncbi:MAG: winged helix-turn-helix domain-containing protein [Burkholderiales bacterium]
MGRRAGRYQEVSRRVVVEDLVIDAETREVTRAGEQVELTHKEFALLHLLASAPGKPFSRAQILNHVWGHHSDPLTNVVDVFVSHIRRKIDTNHSVKLLQTIRSVGYRIAPASLAQSQQTHSNGPVAASHRLPQVPAIPAPAAPHPANRKYFEVPRQNSPWIPLD